MVPDGQAAVLEPSREGVGGATAEPIDFDSLVSSHQRRIYRVLLGMLRDRDAAETLTQECFLRAYRSRATFRGDASVGPWLIKIAVNLARDHWRSRLRGFWQRHFSSSEEDSNLPEAVPDSHPSPEEMLLKKERMASVWFAVETLSPRQRAVFILRFVEEMSLKEIAEATSLKVGTVQIHLFRAVQSVREQLKDGKQYE